MAKKASLPGISSKKEYNIGIGLVCMSLGCVAIFGLLFFIGHLLYGNFFYCLLLLNISVIVTISIYKLGADYLIDVQGKINIHL